MAKRCNDWQLLALSWRLMYELTYMIHLMGIQNATTSCSFLHQKQWQLCCTLPWWCQQFHHCSNPQEQEDSSPLYMKGKFWIQKTLLLTLSHSALHSLYVLCFVLSNLRGCRHWRVNKTGWKRCWSKLRMMKWLQYLNNRHNKGSYTSHLSYQKDYKNFGCWMRSENPKSNCWKFSSSTLKILTSDVTIFRSLSNPAEHAKP